MSLDAMRARRLVEARLGRGPQDALEAAVVLEAWAGVPAQRALELARGLMPRRPAEPLPSSSVPAIAQRPKGVLVEGTAFLVTVVAIALWAAPLTTALGVDAVERALRLALPLTLGLQWALLCRHLGRPSGLAGLANRGAALGIAAVVIVAVPAAFLGASGALAGLLTVTWTGGSILIRRGWAPAYCGVVAAAIPPLIAGADALQVVAVVAAVTVTVGAWALRTAGGEAGMPGRWTRTLGAGLTGAGLGVLLVGDATINWAGGVAPALALLPSAAGALWAGQHLWRLAGAFPRALAGVPACAASLDPAPRGGQSVAAPSSTLLGALARFAALTFAGSAALLAFGAATGKAGVLAGFGAVALASLLVGLLESLGRAGTAAFGVACGIAAESLVRLTEAPFAGAGLVAGGAVATAVLLPAALVMLIRPARTLATALWIT